jgi:hypothetical protein
MFLLFLSIFSKGNSQTNPTYSFLVAGHAYGAHAGDNLGLHPPLLQRLSENPDSAVFGIFLTGDIVNHSTEASWNQVASELKSLGLNSYYVMGNHDNNSIGYKVFGEKHGGAYYSFVEGNELFIVLNSTESDRSISSEQLIFFDNVLINTSDKWERAFIFFHEVIWNSHEKYKDVRSNSRSRYSKLVDISNFWEDIYPKLSDLRDKKFFLFAGDVGGNPDAISASYDTWENVTLISSGMGEVKDENYLKVSVSPDTVVFQLIPLNDNFEMNPITWYNIPEPPDSIIGPSVVLPAQTQVEYQVTSVSNATNYKWMLSNGITGNSDSAKIFLNFYKDFYSGHIGVKAVNDGFGESETVEFEIISNPNTLVKESFTKPQLTILQKEMVLQLDFVSDQNETVKIAFYDFQGRVLFEDKILMKSGFNSTIFNKNQFKKGFAIIQVSGKKLQVSKKIVLY